MSDKRRRYRKPKEDKQQVSGRTITIARRQNDDAQKSSEVQPKILLKPRTVEKDATKEYEKETVEQPSISDTNQIPQRTIVVASRNESATATANTQSSAVSKDQQPTNDSEPMPTMTRPATILSSTGVVSTNAKKLLKDTDTDFFVVGVIGTQGVGKSTILNLLANDDCDYYQKIFLDEDGYFPTKIKQHKCPSRSRTESTHLFIKSDRMILLDCSPVLCNSYKKDMTTNELDDLRSIVNFLSVCHLVIVVYTDYLNINLIRLIRLAEIMKSSYKSNKTADDYYPNLLFIKNLAKRRDFGMAEQKQMNDMIQAFFHDSKMRIHRGKRVEKNLHSKRAAGGGDHTSSAENEISVNTFVFPEVKEDLNAVPYHKPLNEIIEDLRWLVFTTPRNDISTNNIEFSEIAWFELFEKVAQTTQQFFYNTYDEIHRSHLDVVSGSNMHNVNGGGAREIQDNWKD